VGESPGHRRRRGGEGRTSRLSVRLNDPELAQLRQRARARGLSVTRLLVDAALAQPAQPTDGTSATPAADEPSEVFEGIEQRRRRGEDRSLRLSVRLNGRERDDLVGRARARYVFDGDYARAHPEALDAGHQAMVHAIITAKLFDDGEVIVTPTQFRQWINAQQAQQNASGGAQ